MNEGLKANDTELGSSSSSSTFEGSGGGKVSEVDDAAEMENSTASSSTYEGVSPADFTQYSEMVEVRLDGIFAASVVMVFALFICAGILAASTLLRSLEGFK